MAAVPVSPYNVKCSLNELLILSHLFIKIHPKYKSLTYKSHVQFWPFVCNVCRRSWIEFTKMWWRKWTRWASSKKRSFYWLTTTRLSRSPRDTAHLYVTGETHHCITGAAPGVWLFRFLFRNWLCRSVLTNWHAVLSPPLQSGFQTNTVPLGR